MNKKLQKQKIFIDIFSKAFDEYYLAKNTFETILLKRIIHEIQIVFTLKTYAYLSYIVIDNYIIYCYDKNDVLCEYEKTEECIKSINEFIISYKNLIPNKKMFIKKINNFDVFNEKHLKDAFKIQLNFKKNV